MAMKTTPQKIARVLMFTGFSVFVGTVVTYALIMMNPSGWSGRQSVWLDSFLLIGFVSFLVGALACWWTKNPNLAPSSVSRPTIIEWAVIIILIGMMALIIFPTVS
jgi:hypothetical protein